MTSHKKKLVLVTDSYWPSTGGVETWVHGYAAYLREYYKVAIVAHSKNSNQGGILAKTVFIKRFENYCDDYENPVISLAPSLLGRLAMLPFVLWEMPYIKKTMAKSLFDFLYGFYAIAFKQKLARLLKDANIVHCFSTSYLAVCTSIICKDRTIRLIQSPAVHFGKWGDSLLLLWSYANATAILCLSHSFKSTYATLAPNNTTPIHVVPPLLIDKIQADEPQHMQSAPFILFLGRREKHKGVDLLTHCFKTVSAKVSLVIAGPVLEQPVSQENVHDLGNVSDKEKLWLLQNCLFLCVPSSEESFGIVYLEAMAQSKAIVALDIAPVNEIVEQDISGILVDPLNRQHLSLALNKLCSNPELCCTMGRNAKKRYDEKYSGDEVLKKVLHLYNK